MKSLFYVTCTIFSYYLLSNAVRYAFTFIYRHAWMKYYYHWPIRNDASNATS